MRKFVILAALGPVLALAGCAENTGWNPNYSAVQNGTGYAKYSREREAALRGSAPIPRTIPVARPSGAKRRMNEVMCFLWENFVPSSSSSKCSAIHC